MKPIQVRIPRKIWADARKHFADHGGNFQSTLSYVVCAELSRLVGTDRAEEHTRHDRSARGRHVAE